MDNTRLMVRSLGHLDSKSLLNLSSIVESVSVSCYDEFDLCFIASSGSSNPAPTATSLALSSSVTLASWGSATTTSTNIPLAVSRKRKLVSLRKRAADPSLTSYIYGGA